MLLSNWISIFFSPDSINFLRELRKIGYLLNNQFVVLEKTLESPLDCKEIKAVNLKGNHSWIFIGKTDVEAEIPILWLPYVKNWLIGKTEGRRRRRTDDEMVGWHHWLHGHEFEHAPGVDHGQGSWLAAVHEIAESDMTEWLNWIIPVCYKII